VMDIVKKVIRSRTVLAKQALMNTKTAAAQ